MNIVLKYEDFVSCTSLVNVEHGFVITTKSNTIRSAIDGFTLIYTLSKKYGLINVYKNCKVIEFKNTKNISSLVFASRDFETHTAVEYRKIKLTNLQEEWVKEEK
jgi:hypothetical protein